MVDLKNFRKFHQNQKFWALFSANTTKMKRKGKILTKILTFDLFNPQNFTEYLINRVILIILQKNKLIDL